MSTFSDNLVEVVKEYFPNNTAPAGLLQKVEAVYDSTSAIGAFEMDVVLPKHSNKQVDVTFADQDFKYTITYTKNSVQTTRTFFGTIPSLEYTDAVAVRNAVEKAFRDAVFLDQANQKKNIASILGFNALWKIEVESGDVKLKLLIPSSVQDFSVSALTYANPPNATLITGIANSEDLISAVIGTWDGTLANIPTGGKTIVPLTSATVVNQGKIQFEDASGKHYFGMIANGNYSTGAELETQLQTAIQGAYYLNDSNNAQTFGAGTVSFDATTKKFTFDANTASKFVPVNGSAYAIYKLEDETGFLSGLKVSQVDLDNRTGNFGGSVVIDSSNNKLKYEVKYIDSAKDQQTFVSTVTLTNNASYDLSGLSAELETQLNVGLVDLGAWTVAVNTLDDGTPTNNLRVVYDASGSTQRSIESVKFLPIANDAYERVKIQGSLYDNVKIANNIVFNDTDTIKPLPDAGLTVNVSLNYQIIYTESSVLHNELKSADISGVFTTVEDLETDVASKLNTADGASRWAVNWNQSTEKFEISYTPGARTGVQIKFTNDAGAQLLKITQVNYNTASNSAINITVNKFTENFVTVPASASLDLIKNSDSPINYTIESKSYLSGDSLADAIDDGDLSVYWKDDHLRVAYNLASAHNDTIVLQTTDALRQLLKLGGGFFVASGIDGKSSKEVELWAATGDSHNVKLKIPTITSLFPDASDNIVKRFFPDASDNILDIYRLTDGLKNVVLDASQSYIKAVGRTSDNHIQNDYTGDVQNQDLRIQVFLGGATAGSQMYTVTVQDDESVTRTYNVFVTGTEFSYIGNGSAQSLIENMIRKTYDEELYEQIRDNIEVKVKELISYILQEWVVAVNNDPQQSDYLTNNVLGDLQAKIVDKIADPSGVFSLLKPEEYATMIQAFQGVIPDAKGSSYIALRTLESNDFLADPHEMYVAFRKNAVNIYSILGISAPANVEEFLREYFDRILRAYAEMVRRYLLLPQENMTVFKPANIAIALAYSMGITPVGDFGAANNNDFGEYYINFADVSSESTSVKMSNLVNAIAHNIMDNNGQKKSEELITSVLNSAKDVTDSLAKVLTLIDTAKNDEQDTRTKGLGLQSGNDDGLGYLTTILLSHHLLHKILVDGNSSLFKSADKLTEARWNRLMLAYEQEGRCIPVEYLKAVDYSVLDDISVSEQVRLSRIGAGLFEVFDSATTVDPDVKNIGNLWAYMQKFIKKVDELNGGQGQEISVVAVSGAVQVDASHEGEIIIKGKHANKTEGLLRYYIDTLYDFVVLEGATAPAHTHVVIPLYKHLKNSDVGKGMTHSLFYRSALENQFSDILRILGTHFGTASTYFEDLTVVHSGQDTLELAIPDLDISGEAMTKEQLQEVVAESLNDLMEVMNDKMRVRIFGTVLREDPVNGRVSLTATPELQAQVELMKFFDSYIKRFSEVDQGLILGLLVQHDKRIRQQEETASSDAQLSSGEYLAEIHRYMDEIIAKKHIREAQFASLADPYTDADGLDASHNNARAIIQSADGIVKARDVIVLGQVFELARSAAVDLWKNDIIAAITIEELRYNATPGANNDLSELLNIYEKAVQQIEDSIIAVSNNKSVVDRTLELLTVGLSGTPEERIAAIQEASRESDALDSAKAMMDCIVVVVGILNAKLEQLIAVQQDLDAKVKNYNRLHAILVKATSDLQNVLGAIPPQFANFTEMAQALATSLKATLNLRDTVVGKVASLRSALNIMQTATLKYKDATIPKVELTEDFTLVSSIVKIMP
jgi:hypothetical protein